MLAIQDNAIETKQLQELSLEFLVRFFSSLDIDFTDGKIEHSRFSKEDKVILIQTLELWETLLEQGETLLEMRNLMIKAMEDLKLDYNCFFKQTLEKSRDLEVSYRSLSLFFENANDNNLSNLSLLNAEIEQCKDLQNPMTFEAVRNEINRAYDRLDLSFHYAMLVLPGYLGSNAVLDQWAKMAHDHKVLLLTDFAHLDEPDDVVEHFETTNHVRSEIYLSNAIMTCNWLVGRGKYDGVGENDDLFLPPSVALAGKFYANRLSQASAGRKYGVIYGGSGVCFKLKKYDLAVLEALGLIPMYFDNGQIIAYSAKTLFNGNNLGLQTYSVVRVFDYVSKVLVDYFNRKTFENFNVRTRKELMHDIVAFLDKHTGAKKLIESFSIKRLEQDMTHKDRVYLELYMEPYFPSKNFLIRLNGKIGNSGKANSWEAYYEQED